MEQMKMNAIWSMSANLIFQPGISPIKCQFSIENEFSLCRKGMFARLNLCVAFASCKKRLQWDEIEGV